MSDFFTLRDQNNIQQISKYLDKLPPFCLDFFLEKETTSSTGTRLAFAIDLAVFFDFIGKCTQT